MHFSYWGYMLWNFWNVRLKLHKYLKDVWKSVFKIADPFLLNRRCISFKISEIRVLFIVDNSPYIFHFFDWIKITLFLL